MIDRVLSLAERRGTGLILLIGLLFACAYVTSLIVRPKPSGRIVIGDALHHYVQLRSAVFDGDLHFTNEYVRLYDLRGDEPETEWVYAPTPTGHIRNLMPVGPALLWSPLFLVVSAGTAIYNALGGSYPLDGYGRIFQATAGVSGVAAAAAGVWICWLLCAQVFDRRAAIWSCLTLWLASSAIYYSLISPTYSHAASLLACSIFWYAWWRTRERTDVSRYLLLGLCTGCAALMRWQDAILLAPVAIDALISRRSAQLSLAARAGRILAAAAAAAGAFTPQMAVWTVLYGQPLALPQGPSFMRWFEPALWQILFSDNHGWFTWTPIVLMALFGLPALWRRDRDLAVGAITFLVLSWYVNAAVADWWAGEAFGARRFISCFPVLALSMAALVDRLAVSRRVLAAASAIVVAHTFLLLLQYQLFMHGLRDVAPYPRGVFDLYLARFVVPFELVNRWLTT